MLQFITELYSNYCLYGTVKLQETSFKIQESKMFIVSLFMCKYSVRLKQCFSQTQGGT